MKAEEEISCDLAIVGCGLAGMAAALFAARCGIDTVQVGMTSQLGFASGLLDVLGVHPAAEGRMVEDPWHAIEQLRCDEPDHPYSRLKTATILEAVTTFLSFLEKNGLPYATGRDRNLAIAVPAGTIKSTYAVPHTMIHGLHAMAAKSPCLLVGFNRLRGFSPMQMAMSLADRWPALRALNIDFPHPSHGELYTEPMARALDSGECRKELISAIRPHLDDARAVGLPAVLGMHRTTAVMAEMQDGLGLPVFEIPTMPPAVPGLRLQEICGQRLPDLGVRHWPNRRVAEVHSRGDDRWVLRVADEHAERRVIARCVMLCSGRFFGQGLHADRDTGVRETIFGLPVAQPRTRNDWHKKEFLHPAGHPINRAGVMTDASFRPVDQSGRVLYPNLFAAGSILAGQDWMRQKCGGGMAIATAFQAAQACASFLKK
jgi:glycerol-3-phosphate dehydrogenase subunit B